MKTCRSRDKVCIQCHSRCEWRSVYWDGEGCLTAGAGPSFVGISGSESAGVLCAAWSNSVTVVGDMAGVVWVEFVFFFLAFGIFYMRISVRDTSFSTKMYLLLRMAVTYVSKILWGFKFMDHTLVWLWRYDLNCKRYVLAKEVSQGPIDSPDAWSLTQVGWSYRGGWR